MQRTLISIVSIIINVIVSTLPPKNCSHCVLRLWHSCCFLRLCFTGQVHSQTFVRLWHSCCFLRLGCTHGSDAIFWRADYGFSARSLFWRRGAYVAWPRIDAGTSLHFWMYLCRTAYMPLSCEISTTLATINRTCAQACEIKRKGENKIMHQQFTTRSH